MKKKEENRKSKKRNIYEMGNRTQHMQFMFRARFYTRCSQSTVKCRIQRAIHNKKVEEVITTLLL